MLGRTLRYRTPLFVALALLAASLPPQMAAAQSVAHDGRVRITTTGTTRQVTGVLQGAGADSVVVHDSAGRRLAAFGRGEVRLIEVSRGQESRGAAFWRGALRGGLIGAGVGAFMGWFGDTCRDRDGNPSTCDVEVSHAMQIAQGTAGVGVIGALIGGLVAKPRERWAVAELPIRVRIVPFGSGAAAAVATVHF